MQTHLSSNQSKYQTRNPIKKWLLKRFIYNITTLIGQIKPTTILDVGCGEGLIIEKIIHHNQIDPQKITGVDYSSSALKIAKQKNFDSNFIKMDAQKLKIKSNTYDLVIALEILEHLKNPLQSIKEIKRVSKSHCIFSVPHEPWFSLLSFIAGMYINRFGRHPEHVNFWTLKKFHSLINKEFSNTKVYSSFPWTIVVAQK